MAFGVLDSDAKQDHVVSLEIVKLAKELMTALKASVRAARDGEENEDHFASFQREHDWLLSRCKEKIVRLTGHGPGHHSPAYETSREEFIIVLYDLWGDGFDAFHVDRIRAEIACLGIQKGDDQAHFCCWECDCHYLSVFKCTGCDVARYCSKECQRKSWKDGHKQACKVLKMKWQKLEANKRFMEKPLKEGVIWPSSQIAPNPEFDCFFLKLLLDAISAEQLQGELPSEQSREPLMSKLYRVIHEMEQGRTYPIFADNDESTPPDPESDIAHASLLVFVACGGAEEMSTKEREGFENKETRDIILDDCGVTMMTTGRFLEVYKTCDVLKENPNDPKFRSIVIRSFWDFLSEGLLDHLRLFHHKEADADSEFKK